MSLRKSIQTSFFALLLASVSVSADPWRVHKNNVRVYERKINKLNEEILEAIQKKNQTKAPEEMRPVMKGLVEAHERVNEQIQKRNKELKHMRYRHPEKGQEFEREYYKTYRIKSLKAYEEELGISGRLSRLKQKVNKHYGVQTKEEIRSKKNRDKLKENIEKSIKLVK